MTGSVILVLIGWAMSSAIAYQLGRRQVLSSWKAADELRRSTRRRGARLGRVKIRRF